MIMLNLPDGQLPCGVIVLVIKKNEFSLEYNLLER